MTMLQMKYGSKQSCEFTEAIAREMAVAGWETGLALAKEKGPAPIMDEVFDVSAEMLRKRPEMGKDGWKIGQKIEGRVLHAKYSRYMQQVASVAPDLVDALAEVGCRFTHHSSIAPTGTISLLSLIHIWVGHWRPPPHRPPSNPRCRQRSRDRRG